MVFRTWHLVLLTGIYMANMAEQNTTLSKGKEKTVLKAPEKIGGWEKKTESKEFTPRSIFHYMNGAGEIYRAYDMVVLQVHEYTRSTESPITVEVYTLSSSQNAYGVSTFDPDGEEIQIKGRSALYGAGLLRFWKGRYFIRIITEKESAESKSFQIELAEYLLKQIEEPDTLPEILKWLPKEKLQERSLCYFHTTAILNVHYYLSNGNILNLTSETDALLARYSIGNEKLRVLIVSYPTAKEALAASQQFTKQYLKREAFLGMHIQEVEQGQLVGIDCKPKVVILVFEAQKRKAVTQLITAITEKIQGR